MSTLNDVSQADFDSAKLLYKELLSTGNPSLDLRDGTAISDTVVNPASQAGAYMNVGVQTVRGQMSFKLMQDNPALASQDAMDNLAANFNIVRKQGMQAAGQALIYLTSNQEYTAPSGYQLSNSGLLYQSAQAWALRRGWRKLMLSARRP